MDHETAAESFRKALRDYGGAVFLAVLFAFLIRFFVIEAYRIPSTSMRPTLEPGDTIFVAKWPYGLHLPGRDEPLTEGRKPRYGDVVVFSLPSEPGRDYIKRVIGLEGDTVQVSRGHVLLNGKPLAVGPGDRDATCGEEQVGAVRYGACWEPPQIPDFGPERVPSGYVYVLGDMRSGNVELAKPGGSMIPVSALRARALWIWLSIEPPGHGGLFSRIRFERMFRRVE